METADGPVCYSSIANGLIVTTHDSSFEEAALAGIWGITLPCIFLHGHYDQSCKRLIRDLSVMESHRGGGGGEKQGQDYFNCGSPSLEYTPWKSEQGSNFISKDIKKEFFRWAFNVP